MTECSGSDLDPGYCLTHGCYITDAEHPHTWMTCDADPCEVCG